MRSILTFSSRCPQKNAHCRRRNPHRLLLLRCLKIPCLTVIDGSLLFAVAVFSTVTMGLNTNAMASMESRLASFFSFLNSFRPTIRFLMECEKERKLPFLDVFIERSDIGLLFSIYRKPTHAGQYLHRESSHPGVFS